MINIPTYIFGGYYFLINFVLQFLHIINLIEAKSQTIFLLLELNIQDNIYKGNCMSELGVGNQHAGIAGKVCPASTSVTFIYYTQTLATNGRVD